MISMRFPFRVTFGGSCCASGEPLLPAHLNVNTTVCCPKFASNLQYYITLNTKKTEHLHRHAIALLSANVYFWWFCCSILNDQKQFGDDFNNVTSLKDKVTFFTAHFRLKKKTNNLYL